MHRTSFQGVVLAVAVFTSSALAGDRGAARERPFVVERMEEKDPYKDDVRKVMRLPIYGAVPDSACMEKPEDARVLRAVGFRYREASPGCLKTRKVIRIDKERLVDRIDPPRFYPLVGPAQLHHLHWKCTVCYTERVETGHPFTFCFQRPRWEDVYIDFDHLHLCSVPERKGNNASPSTPRKAGPVAVSTHLALIPPDCEGFVSVRMARMLRTLGVPTDGREPGWHVSLAQAARELGFPVMDLDRLTFIFRSGEPEPVLVFEGARPFAREAVLKAFLHGWNTVKQDGKTLYVTRDIGGQRDLVVHFLSPQLFVAGSKEGVKGLLRSTAKRPDRTPHFTAAQRAAVSSDVVAWGGDGAFSWLRELFPVQAGLVKLDFGVQLKVDMACQCRDRASARKIEKAAHLYREMFTGQIATLCACRELQLLFPKAMGESPEFTTIPVKLFRAIEKGLQHAGIELADTSVSLAITIPVDAKTLYKEIDAAVRRSGTKQDLGSLLWPFSFLGRAQKEGAKQPQDDRPPEQFSPGPKPDREQSPPGKKAETPSKVRGVTSARRYFTITGEVNAPGSYPVDDRADVLDALQLVQGLTCRAARRSIVLVRPQPNGGQAVLPVRYDELVQLGDTATNYLLFDGDEIVVPARGIFKSLLAPTSAGHRPLPPMAAVWGWLAIEGEAASTLESR